MAKRSKNSSKANSASKSSSGKAAEKKSAKKPAIQAKAASAPTKPAAKPAKAPKPIKAAAPVKSAPPAKVKAVRPIELSAKKKRPINNLPVPPAPVATGMRPKKNQAGINSRDLEHFRELLLAKRRELVGDMSQMEREALRSTTGTNLSNLPLHMADMGTDNYEQEFTLGLVEKDRQLLREINQALAKIQDGTYGICEATGKPIGRPRLEAQPWAKYSIEYARQLERGMIRR